MKTIPIFFSFNNDYVEPAAVAFFSLLNKAKKDIYYDMYVLHPDITEPRQNLLKEIINKCENGRLTFINVGNFGEKFWKNDNFSKGSSGSKFTSDTIVRCFATKFFPQFDKIIYSDVDIVVVDDISPLFDMDIGEHYILGVRSPFMKYLPEELSHLPSNVYDICKDSYIGGGIWVMNLKKIRQDNIEQKMFEIIKDDNIVKKWPDQDIMNIACNGNVGFIPLNYIAYPYMLDMIRKPDFVSHYSKAELFDSFINPKIIHYAANKPWNGNPSYSEVWWTIFDFLNLEKTHIFKKNKNIVSKDKKKIRKYKILFILFLVISLVLLLSLIKFMWM